MKYFELIKFLNDNDINYNDGFYYNKNNEMIGGWIRINADIDFDCDDDDELKKYCDEYNE